MVKERPFLKVAMYTLDVMDSGDTYYGDLPVAFHKVFIEAMNVDHQVVLPPDESFGNLLPNGSWTGMVGMVNRSEVEFAISTFSYTVERARAVSYTFPYLFENCLLITPRPKLEADFTGLMKPYSLETWMLILLSFLAITFALAMTEIIEKKLFGLTIDNIFSRNLMWTYETLVNQTTEKVPEQAGGRIIALTWLIGTLVFVKSYSGILTAMLTLPKVHIPIDSLADLVAQDKIPWRIVGGTFLNKFFQESPDPVYREVYERLQGFIPSCSEASEDIVNGKFVTLCNTISISRIIWNHFRRSGKCPVYVAKETVCPTDMLTLILRRNSIFQKKANRIVLALIESGLSEKWFHMNVPKPPECYRSPSQDHSEGIAALNIEALGGPFMLLIGGWVLAAMALLFEVTVSWCWARDS